MKSNPLTGRYLFHCHTKITDATNLVEDYFRFAQIHDIDRIIFLEHIRREPRYSVSDFKKDVNDTASRFHKEAVVGFETRILPDGELDIDRDVFDSADVIGIAEHRFVGETEDNLRALDQVFDRFQVEAKHKTMVWVHPGLWLKKRGQLKEYRHEYSRLMTSASEKGFYIEMNLRYSIARESDLTGISNSRVCYGADAHTPEDLNRWAAQFMGRLPSR